MELSYTKPLSQHRMSQKSVIAEQQVSKDRDSTRDSDSNEENVCENGNMVVVVTGFRNKCSFK